MNGMILLLAVLASLIIGYSVFTWARKNTGSFKDAAIASILILLVGGIVSSYLIPGLNEVFRGFYGVSANSGMGLMIAIGMFIAVLAISGAILTAAPGLQPWHKKGLWLVVGFVGFVYWRILFLGEVKKWWAHKIIPSQEVWPMTFRLQLDPLVGLLVVLGIIWLGSYFVNAVSKK